MLTQTMIDYFAALAGPLFLWDSVPKRSPMGPNERPDSGWRIPLRMDLVARQGGICPVCGNALPGDGSIGGIVEFNHVVARGPHIRGFIKGNIFAGCAPCNSATKPLYDNDGMLISGREILDIDYFARPDLIPLDWTPTPILRRARKRG